MNNFKLREAANKKVMQGLVHDIQGIVGANLGLSQVIRSKHAQDLDEKSQHWLGLMTSSSQHAVNLLTRFGQYSNLISLDARPLPCDLETSFREAAEQLVQPSTRVELNVSGLPVMYTRGDSFLTVFKELIDNSMQHGFRSHGLVIAPAITIACQMNEEYVSFEYYDNGVGVPDEHLGFILKPFKCLDLTQDAGERTQRRFTGLGLSIIQAIVLQHDGELTLLPSSFDSTVGLRVNLRFPRRLVLE